MRACRRIAGAAIPGAGHMIAMARAGTRGRSFQILREGCR